MAQDYLRGPIKTTVTTIGSGATKVPATPLLGRMSVMFQASEDNASAVYLGDSEVTISGGISISPGANFSLDAADSLDVYIVSVNGYKVKTLEIAG